MGLFSKKTKTAIITFLFTENLTPIQLDSNLKTLSDVYPFTHSRLYRDRTHFYIGVKFDHRQKNVLDLSNQLGVMMPDNANFSVEIITDDFGKLSAPSLRNCRMQTILEDLIPSQREKHSLDTHDPLFFPGKNYHKYLSMTGMGYLMGILNVTPDSFSDAGQFYSIDSALRQAERLILDGATIIDIGGESTRPDAMEVAIQEEIDRVIPIIEGIREKISPDFPLSVDTRKSEIADEALRAGADIINDVSAGRRDPNMFNIAAKWQCPLIMMHSRGDPESMQFQTEYENLIEEVAQELKTQVALATSAGVRAWNIIVDPGIGFAKTADQCYELLKNLPRLKSLLDPHPMLVGASRKSFLRKEVGPNTAYGDAVVAGFCTSHGVDILRVHDVKSICDAVKVGRKLR